MKRWGLRYFKVVAILIPLLAISTFIWANLHLAILIAVLAMAAFLSVTGRMTVGRIKREDLIGLGVFFAAFLLAVNFFVFGGGIYSGYWVLYAASAVSLFFIIGAQVLNVLGSEPDPKEFRAATAALTLLSIEAFLLLYFLPFGYLTLSFAFAVWYAAAVSLYGLFSRELLTMRAAATEILLAVFMISAAFISSGIKSR